MAGRSPTDRGACGAGTRPGWQLGAPSKQLRDAVCSFANDTRRASPWAARLYNDAIARGKDHPHAVRILARAWLYVIWHCWHDGTAYDPERHHALQRLLAEHQPAAA